MRSSPLLLLAGVLLASGCTSPETMDEPLVRIAAAVPGLSYVDGDPEAGTTTLVSLPLLTYRETEQLDDRYRSRTCFLPLLSSFATTEHEVHVVWDDAPQGPPDGWWERHGGKRPRKETRRKTRRPRDPAPERSAETAPESEPARPTEPSSRAEATPPRKKDAPGVRHKGSKRGALTARRSPQAHVPEPEEARAEEDRDAFGSRRLVLHLREPGKILRKRTEVETEYSLLLSLWQLRAKRPGLVAVRERDGRLAIYEVGERSDSIRMLPLFSYSSAADSNSLMFWPLLLGKERDPSGSYLRLFYFWRIALD